MGLNASDIKSGGYYTPGIGWSANEPLVYEDENGQRAVMTSGVQRQGKVNDDGGLYQGAGDKLAKAYDLVKASTSGALKRWNKSRTGTNEEQQALRELYAAYVNDGTYRGSFEDFPAWLDWYMQEMQAETMNVRALHNSKGVATKTSDGRLTYAGNERARKSTTGGR